MNKTLKLVQNNSEVALYFENKKLPVTIASLESDGPPEQNGTSLLFKRGELILNIEDVEYIHAKSN